jgi:hypothetical protein
LYGRLPRTSATLLCNYEIAHSEACMAGCREPKQTSTGLSAESNTRNKTNRNREGSTQLCQDQTQPNTDTQKVRPHQNHKIDPADGWVGVMKAGKLRLLLSPTVRCCSLQPRLSSSLSLQSRSCTAICAFHSSLPGINPRHSTGTAMQ